MRYGFTIIELLVCLAIMGIICAIAAAALNEVIKNSATAEATPVTPEVPLPKFTFTKFNTETYPRTMIMTDVETGQQYIYVSTIDSIAISPRLRTVVK
jgi:prepilin-type N-terminal cleavage/methylation domain-containing protein